MDIKKMAKKLELKLKTYRRKFHQYPEVAWTEFWASSKIAEVLMELGYDIQLGKQIISEEAVMGSPDPESLLQEKNRAKEQGANIDILEKMDMRTGVLGVLDTGRPGPTLAFRFEMDALKVTEAMEKEHKPFREGFASIRPGFMHACGHDGHVAVGLCLAELLMDIKKHLKGTIKLIFQPAEEGVRGARAMVEAGVVDDVDYFFGFHLGFGSDEISLVAKTVGLLATSKLDITYTGRSSHAGATPEEGKNALLGAATAVLNLHAISPHSKGVTRINVGVLEAGSGANIVPDRAFMKIETRGETTTVNDYMREKALNILKSSANMYGLDCDISQVGGASSANGDDTLAKLVKHIGVELALSKVQDEYFFGASDDVTYFMERVHEKGGRALYFQVATPIAAKHHNGLFDFDEKGMVVALAVCGELVKKLVRE